MKQVLLILMVTATALGCTKRDERVTFDGVYFRSKSKSISDDRRDFNIEVNKAVQAPNAARQAAAYEATRYCIREWGTSRILWAADPLDENTSLRLENGDLNVQGRCNPQ